MRSPKQKIKIVKRLVSMKIQTLATLKLGIVISNFSLKINSCFHNITVNQIIRKLAKSLTFKNRGILGVDKK